ncbi:MAG: helix-turn-helix domain-containing protein, partial [Burkholderiales bacterium]|nr:helix-turn-helix domain-containing protein [Burkholderiales bacterium]
LGDRLPISGGMRIQPAIWQTPEFVALTPAAKLTWLLLSTAPETNLAGIVPAHPAVIAKLCGIKTREAATALAQLDQLGLIDYDAERCVVWIRGHMARQLGAMKPNAAQVRGAAAVLDRMPETDMVAAFRRLYGIPARGVVTAHRQEKRRAKAAQKRGSSDRVSDRVPGDRPGGPSPGTVPSVTSYLPSTSASVLLHEDDADTPTADTSDAATPTHARHAGGAS